MFCFVFQIRGTLKSWAKYWCVVKPGIIIVYKSDKVSQSFFDLFIYLFLVDACLRSERGFQVRHEVFGKMEKNYCTANFMKSIFVSVSPWRLITNSSTELKRLKIEIFTLGFPSYLTYILWNENLYYFLINSNMCENINFASSASPLGGYDSY